MKIFSISDLHLSINNPKPMDIFGPAWDNYVDAIIEDWNKKVSNEDVVLIAGDISWAMKPADAKPDLDLISALPGTKIIIRGNHDYWWQSITGVRSMLGENFFALQNDHITLGNYIFCGTRGWQVPETGCFKTPQDEKIFNRELIRLELSLKSAKEAQNKLNEEGKQAKIVCMIHYPPFNLKQQPSAFTKLFEDYGVSTVVYGHLHGSKCRKKFLTQLGNVNYYLTSCDLIDNKLVEIKV